MDIYKFIDSKDIRNYLKEINYKFEPLEAAWVVWQNASRTLDEKHNAWQEIIDAMPDIRLEVSHINETGNLHEYLGDWKFLCLFTTSIQEWKNSHYRASVIFSFGILQYGELYSEKRILKALSNFLKGKIDVGLFANAYHHYMRENYCQRTKPLFDYPDEDLKLVGFKEEEIWIEKSI